MCEPVTIMMGVSLAIGAATAVTQYQNAKKQVKAIARQSEIQAQEIADQKGVELTERARAARRERGAMRAAASEAGINLGSNSFLAALQTSAINEVNDSGLIIANGRAQQQARVANTNSLFAQNPVPSAWMSALQIGASGVNGYYTGKAYERAGAESVTKP